MSPRGWHVPGLEPGTPPAGGRRPKAGTVKTMVRLDGATRAALDAEADRLRAAGQVGIGLGEAIASILRRAPG